MVQKLIPPLLFPSPDASERKRLEALKKQKLIYRAGPRLYASVPKKELEKTVRTNWSQIVSKLFPAAILSHRSAIEFTPDEQGFIHLTANTNRIVEYPGLRLKFHKGPKALASDHDFLTMKSSSLERALLENLSVRRTGSIIAGLPVEVLEKRLEEILQNNGEMALNKIREGARTIAQTHQWMPEFNKLNQIIGALLGSKKTSGLKSRKAVARAIGRPYDSDCIERLEGLFAQLKQTSFKALIDPGRGSEHFFNKAFFEAYFSNYIEGTTFEIEEAEEIVFDKKPLLKRLKDSHDIIGTFEIVSDPNEMRKTPKNVDDLLALLKIRHRKMMSQRAEVAPGEFKTKPNRAGDTHFVHPDHILGTLEQGFGFYLALPKGFCRAAYIMFFVAEIHPFMDGNGRVARMMMNAELVSANTSTIIIPNVYREDYLLSLRALSRRVRPEPLIKMLQKAYDFSNLDFSKYDKIFKTLQKNNWFSEPDEAQIIF